MSWNSVWDKSEALIKKWSFNPFPRIELRFNWHRVIGDSYLDWQQALTFDTNQWSGSPQCWYKPGFTEYMLIDLGDGRRLEDEHDMTELEKAMDFMPTLFEMYSIGCQCIALNGLHWSMGTGWVLAGRLVKWCPECGTKLHTLNSSLPDEIIPDRFGRLGL